MMRKNASAMLADGLRGDGRKLAEAVSQFRSLHAEREQYRLALAADLQKRWREDADVVTCSVARNKQLDPVYTLIVSGCGKTYTLVVTPGRQDAYDVERVSEVGERAQRELASREAR